MDLFSLLRDFFSRGFANFEGFFLLGVLEDILGFYGTFPPFYEFVFISKKFFEVLERSRGEISSDALKFLRILQD